ncbi:uncharacterized protein tmem79b isoform X2 [Brachyhypopomus gauderio]|uniref:uncharacterized protein tmem79b isoform X2 n=1 Tax=Brachyhypopomus gauderio TaxID=698409 RepID=UPI0040429F00
MQSASREREDTERPIENSGIFREEEDVSTSTAQLPQYDVQPQPITHSADLALKFNICRTGSARGAREQSASPLTPAPLTRHLDTPERPQTGRGRFFGKLTKLEESFLRDTDNRDRQTGEQAISLDTLPVVKSPEGPTEENHTPGQVTEEKKMNTHTDPVLGSKEPSTLPWPEERSDGPGGKGPAAPDSAPKKDDPDVAEETASMSSDSPSLRGRFSRTESAKELGTWERQQAKGCRVEKERLLQGDQVKHLEIEVELNSMPDKAAGVFNSTSIPEPLRQSMSRWVEETEDNPFIRHANTLPVGYSSSTKHVPCCGCTGTKRDLVKVAVAVLMAAMIFPVLVWGGYTFLPFDAPLLDSAPLRLVYTLRCSVFAVIPIVLGVLVLGVSRLRYLSVKPQCDGEPEIEAVIVHRNFVEDSISLFLMYFLQLGVMAAYLSQELLKLVPLLTIIFAFGRLVYWIAAVWGSSVRGFGFGFSFVPTLVMLVANLYFIFMADSAGSVFAQEDLGPIYLLQEKRQRFWG